VSDINNQRPTEARVSTRIAVLMPVIAIMVKNNNNSDTDIPCSQF